MPVRQRFAIQSLIITVVLNAILLAVVYYLIGNIVQAANQVPLFFIAGAIITLVLWLAIAFVGSRAIAGSTQAPSAADASRVAQRERVRPITQEPTRTAEAGAVQLLSILQRQGRLVDFLQEDLSPYDDAQIGAAVRNIHAECKQALAEHVTLEPIFQESEGSRVTVQSGFDPHAIRLTGDVVGEPPFNGELQHKGWRVVKIDLPKQLSGQDPGMIVAAAEVEVQA
jgi:hypothetical protein